jgi:hypothetical protein
LESFICMVLTAVHARHFMRFAVYQDTHGITMGCGGSPRWCHVHTTFLTWKVACNLGGGGGGEHVEKGKRRGEDIQTIITTGRPAAGRRGVWMCVVVDLTLWGNGIKSGTGKIPELRDRVTT